MISRRCVACLLAFVVLAIPALHAQPRQMENLTRGIVAVAQDDGSVFVSWRLFATDPDGTAFNLYRVSNGGPAEKVNAEPIDGATNYIDRGADTSHALEYFLRPVVDGRELEPSHRATVWERNFLEIPIQRPDGGEVDGRPFQYRASDATVADLDGDGEYEIVLKWDPSNMQDNSFAGYTGSTILDAYRMDGTRLWRIDLGRNIRAGQHYTQFMVYDLDGDGRAEVALKTADGTVDGTGAVIGDPEKDWRTYAPDNRRHGRILDGPEYFTIFDGLTGRALETVDYIPCRDPIDGWGGIGGNGGTDNFGNRVDRFLACVAYLDGERPSVVMARGVYGRTVLAAWDWRDGKLTSRWVFDSGISYPPFDDASPFSGMGGHSLAVADVDGDGRDEIVYHAMVVDDNGEGLYSTRMRHGDALHVSDFYPDRPGLEIMTVTENEDDTVRFRNPGVMVRDAATGEILWSHSPGIDVGAGVAADIDPRYRGYEVWGGPGGLRDSQGNDVGPAPRATGFVIWWDGDLLREIMQGNSVAKWQRETSRLETIFTPERPGAGGRRGGFGGFGGVVNLTGDLIGDWREEILTSAPTGDALRLYTTTIPTEHRLYTLMHDAQYRLAITWQNVVYNQPPHPSFFLGHEMPEPPRPDIYLIGGGDAIEGVRAVPAAAR